MPGHGATSRLTVPLLSGALGFAASRSAAQSRPLRRSQRGGETGAAVFAEYLGDCGLIGL